MRCGLMLFVTVASAWAAVGATAQDQPGPTYVNGVDVQVFDIGEQMEEVPRLIEGQTPNVNTVRPVIDLETEEDFGLGDRFLTYIRTMLVVDQPGRYTLRLTSDDGAVLYRYQQGRKLVIDHDGLHSATSKEAEVQFDAGRHHLLIQHFDNDGPQMLRLEWKPPGATEFELVPAEALWVEEGVVRVTSPGKKVIQAGLVGRPPTPGDVSPLDAVHPAYDLLTIRPEGFEPKVGGMDFFSDGRLVISCWEPDGGVYLLDGVHGDDRAAITVQRIAAGLTEPLGLRVIRKGDALARDRDRLFVLQKHELTELIDHDGDDVIDEYRVVCADWPVTDNFHEFAFGLAYRDGKLYGTLALAIFPGGKTVPDQEPGRGRVIEVHPDTGEHRFLAYGLRTPNGIGIGHGGDLFITDNQGDWKPSSQLLRFEPDAFYGSYAALPEGYEPPAVTPPVVWLPQNEIGNSPGQPGLFPENSPFPGQMLHGEITHGGLKRVFIEEVNDTLQGAVFRFTQGLEAGINRFVTAPNGDLFVGGVGGPGNWSHFDNRFGLQRLRHNGNPVFEIKAIRAKTNGFEIEFTEPLATGVGWDPGDYTLRRWYYEPTEQYGGPPLERTYVAARGAVVQPDRRRVHLDLGGMKPGHVYHLRLDREDVVSEQGRPLWSTDAWYTMNRVPNDRPLRLEPAADAVMLQSENVRPLSDAERDAGWVSLFDGRTASGWRRFQGDAFPEAGWLIDDGTLRHVGRIGGGDIAYPVPFRDFELELEWKIAPGGNSGIFYRVDEASGQAAWQTGAEMQVLDDDLHPNGQNPKTSAGALYDLIAPNEAKALRPVGQWNHVRIVADGPRVEHWLNGRKVLSYDAESASFRELVQRTKFAPHAGFAAPREGVVVLQDHGDDVWYRNLRLRELR